MLRYLPKITCEGHAVRLRLREELSVALESALLLGEVESRREALLRCFGSEPSFLLWVICRAWWEEGQELASPAEAACWLAPRLLDELAGLADPDSADLNQQAAPCPGAGAAALRREHQGPASSGSVPVPASNAPVFGSCSQVLGELAQLARGLPPRARAFAEGVCSPEGTAAELKFSGGPISQNGSVGGRASAQRLSAVVRLLLRQRELESRFQAALEREKLESLRQLAYGAGHEINNPLANISARAQALLKEERDPQRRRKLAAIHSQAFRAHEMIVDLMLFARPPRLAKCTLDLVPLCDRVLEELSVEAENRGIQLVRQNSEGRAWTQADEMQLAVALRALLVNSLEAIGRDGLVELSVSRGANGAEIYVRDTGPGISTEVRRHLFDPFYSGREAGRGLGFGLSKCWRIVTEHGGEITVESPPDGGAMFTIRLPLADAPQEALRDDLRRG